jgi:hypothetical protein
LDERLLEALGHDVEEKLKGVTVNLGLQLDAIDGIDELGLSYITVTCFVSGSQRLLKRNLVVRESQVSDFLDNQLGFAVDCVLLECNLLLKVAFKHFVLNSTSVIWVKLVKDLVNFLVREDLVLT